MKRRDEVLVGVMLTAAIAVALLGTLWLVRGGLSNGYPLYATFPWGQGLKQGQPVLLTGVNVGYVASIKLQDEGTLTVTMRVRDEYQVPAGTTATIEPNGLFGDVLIALRPAGPNAQKIAAGSTVPTGQSAPGMGAIIARADTVSRTVNDLTRSIELELVQGGAITDLRKTVAGTNQLVAQLNRIAIEQSRQLTATTAALRRAVGAIDSAAVDSTVRNLRATTANTARLTAQLESTTVRLNGVLASVDSGTGTIGKFVRDPALYNDVRSLVTRLDSLTIDIKKNPRRYINLEIF